MIKHHEALIFTMVLVAAADRQMSDSELQAIGDQIDHLPIFKEFDFNRLGDVSQQCAELMQEEDGLDQAIGMIRGALSGRLRETAYALACEVAAADGEVAQEEIRLLEMLRHGLELDRLIAAGIERGTAARYARPPAESL